MDGILKGRLFALSLCAALVFALSPLHAQNKVITHSYPWEIAATEHFDIYHYGRSGAALMPFVASCAEEGLARARTVLPVEVKDRVPFFLYNNHNDFEESNITSIGEGTGGVTEAFKNRLLLAPSGSRRYLEHVITHEITHEVEFIYLFSGFWRSARLLKFIFYPNWLTEGTAEYVSGGLDATAREMVLRDAATSRRLLPLAKLHNFNHVQPHQVTLAYKESEAFIRYIADEYGEDKVVRLFRDYEDFIDVSPLLYDVVGADLPTLDRRFREYLEDNYRSAASLSEPSVYGERLSPAGAYPRICASAVFSPDGRTVAWIGDHSGRNEIFLRELASGRVSRLRDMGGTLRVEEIHGEGNGLAFSPDGRFLAFCGERVQKDYLYVYDLRRHSLRELDPCMESTASPAFSMEGGTIYFSGLKEGVRDIYAFDLRDGKVAPLTRGEMDKIDVVVTPDGNSLVYAAERRSPSGRVEYDLCEQRLADGTTRYLTALPGDERSPWFSADGATLYFTSDRDGVTDIYALAPADGRITRLTEVVGGAFEPRPAPDGKQLLFSSFRKGEQAVYIGDMDRFTGKPVREEVAAAAAPAGPAVPSAHDFQTRPCRFRAGTDLFFPALFYSSADGVYLATYWQASDLLGDHALQSIVMYAGESNTIDYRVSYGFLRYRPQFFLSANGQGYYDDAGRTVRIDEETQELQVLYPLNRYQQAGVVLSTTDRRKSFSTHPEDNWRRRENTAGLVFLHDTTRGPYLERTSGAALSLSGEFSDRVLSGDYRFQSYGAQLGAFFPLGNEQTLLWRTQAAGSWGEDPEQFRLGGAARVRGVPEQSESDGDVRYAGSKLFVNSLEWRFPLAHDIDYHFDYVFPDFLFKSLYGTFFADAGAVWDGDGEFRHLSLDRWKASCGIGLRCHTFIMQLYPLLLSLQAADRLDRAGTAVYFSLGTEF